MFWSTRATPRPLLCGTAAARQLLLPTYVLRTYIRACLHYNNKKTDTYHQACIYGTVRIYKVCVSLATHEPSDAYSPPVPRFSTPLPFFTHTNVHNPDSLAQTRFSLIQMSTNLILSRRHSVPSSHVFLLCRTTVTMFTITQSVTSQKSIASEARAVPCNRALAIQCRDSRHLPFSRSNSKTSTPAPPPTSLAPRAT